MLPKPAESIAIMPHSDGRARNAIIHTNETEYANQISFEPMDAPANVNTNYFRSQAFYQNDPDADIGGDGVRAFFGRGGITLSVTPGERVWTPKAFGPVGDFADIY